MIGPLLHLYQCRISPTQINLIFLSWIYFLLYCPALAISNQFFSPLTLPAASEHVFFLTHNESLQSNKRVENLLFTSFTSFTSLTMIRSYKWNIWDIFFLNGKYFFPKKYFFSQRQWTNSPYILLRKHLCSLWIKVSKRYSWLKLSSPTSINNIKI